MSRREEARAFLRAQLEAGPVTFAELVERAEAEGVAVATLRRAAGDLEVVHQRVGFGPGSHLEWKLPGPRRRRRRAAIRRKVTA